jgi:hypothetical protein
MIHGSPEESPGKSGGMSWTFTDKIKDGTLWGYKFCVKSWCHS